MMKYENSMTPLEIYLAAIQIVREDLNGRLLRASEKADGEAVELFQHLLSQLPGMEDEARAVPPGMLNNKQFLGAAYELLKMFS